MQENNNLYFIFFDSVFSWKHKPWLILKPIIKLLTKSNYNHCGYMYDYANQREYIKEHLHRFTSTHYLKSKKDRYCRCIAYKAKFKIDFEKLHQATQNYLNSPYGYAEMVKPLIYKIPVVNKIYSFIFGAHENDNDSICSATAFFLAVKDQGYLVNIDSSSLSPEGLRKLLLKHNLVEKDYIDVWSKNIFINNIFE